MQTPSRHHARRPDNDVLDTMTITLPADDVKTSLNALLVYFDDKEDEQRKHIYQLQMKR